MPSGFPNEVKNLIKNIHLYLHYTRQSRGLLSLALPTPVCLHFFFKETLNAKVKTYFHTTSPPPDKAGDGEEGTLTLDHRQCPPEVAPCVILHANLQPPSCKRTAKLLNTVKPTVSCIRIRNFKGWRQAVSFTAKKFPEHIVQPFCYLSINSNSFLSQTSGRDFYLVLFNECFHWNTK